MSVAEWNRFVGIMLDAFNHCFAWLGSIQIGPLTLLEYFIGFTAFSIILGVILHIGVHPAHLEARNGSRSSSSGYVEGSIYNDSDYPSVKD